MTATALAEYAEAFHADVAANAKALDMLTEHAFVDKIAAALIDYGEMTDCEPCHFQSHGVKVDAYDFDEEYTSLNLVVSLWLGKADPSTARVANSVVDRHLNRARAFLERSLKGTMADAIDVANPAHDLASLIHECRGSLRAVKVVFVTDGCTDQRRAEIDSYEGIEIRSVIWDINRFQTFDQTGEREQISIDFEEEYGAAIPCLEKPSPDGQYVTYLAFISGDVLADLYGDWKIRLLERNVRVFLSQRVKVNQGIRDTIRDESPMFCAYNNGITVHAQSVDLKVLSDGGLGISRVVDFQIVNGGQTTASLYHTREKYKVDLSDISVQMKLMVINDDLRPAYLPSDQRLSDLLVPKIGRFSNTQNRVQMADLLANDPPHPELQTISMNMAAPDPSGGSVQTFWFYERSRGGYEETRRLTAKTTAQQRKFDQKFPRAQRFDKAKFGKAWNSYRKRPYVVCLGAMKNFAQFNTWLQEQKTESWDEFFQKTVALILMWNEAERFVRRQKFGGYTHAIVAYSLAWLHELTGLRVDLGRIWLAQQLDDVFYDAIERTSSVVNEHIRKTRLNVTEWCKKEECWRELCNRSAPALPDLSGVLLSGRISKRYDEAAEAETENIQFCKEKGADAWFALAKWLKERDFMQGKQRSQCFNMGRTIKNAKKDPSQVLSIACRKIWEKAVDGYGWNAGEPVRNVRVVED